MYKFFLAYSVNIGRYIGNVVPFPIKVIGNRFLRLSLSSDDHTRVIFQCRVVNNRPSGRLFYV